MLWRKSPSQLRDKLCDETNKNQSPLQIHIIKYFETQFVKKTYTEQPWF
jgi:hypothetical protein